MRAISDLQELQKIEFDMMVYLDKIAKDNGLHIMLAGGTLLGAIRHRGFIPWDDDVDINILRDEYEQLIKLVNQDKDSPYKVMTAYNTLTYPYAFAKMTDTRTIRKSGNQLEIKGMGVTIDLFPIDGVPKKKPIVESLFRYSLDTSEQITALQDTNYKKLDGTLEYWRRIFAIKLKAISVDMLSRITKVDKARYVAGVLGKYGMDEIVRHEDMCRYVRVEFCGQEFLAPKGYKIYLTKHYGKNYMKLPPESQRRALHPDNFYWL